LKNITLTGNVNRTSNSMGTKYEDHESICGCGEKYTAYTKLHLPSREEPLELVYKMCPACEKEKEDKELAKKIEEENRQRAEEKERERKQRFYEIFDDYSLMNPKLKQVTFDSYEPLNEELEKAKQITKRYADNFSSDNPVSLLLIGNYGTGKSHLSASITKELIAKEVSSVFVSTPKLLTKIRSTYNKTSFFSEQDIMKTLSEVDCLVLDDIGSETTKQGDNNQHTWATSKIFEIIDNRIGKHTIFTSNYEPSELQERLGGRNFSRMMENTHVIKMYGEDYRLRSFK
jgi:DNA replication protein DnaC